MSKDMKKAVCVINLQVMNVNGFVTATINGHSTPNTFIGFKTALIMNLEKKLNKNDALLKHDSLAKNTVQIFHKVEQVNSDMYKTDASNYNKKKSGLVSKTIMDNKVLNEDISLIFEFYIDPDKKEEIESLINKEIQKMRFGGGFIKNSKAKLIIDGNLDKDGNKIDIMKEIARSVKKGFVMKECDDKDHDDKDHGNIKNIDDLLNSLNIKKLRFKKENEKSTWKTATVLGYALLNKPENTDFSRFGHKHAFAEPLIGLVEFEFFHKYIKEVTYENFFKVGWITLFEKVYSDNNGIIRYITDEK